MDLNYIVPSDEDLNAAMALYTAWLDRQIEAETQAAAVDSMGDIEA